MVSVIQHTSTVLFTLFVQIHLFDIDIPGKQRFKESEVLSPGNKPLSFDTGGIAATNHELCMFL